ncbi:glycosyltransferase [Cellulomonas sp. Sa3CUA2]|uniref:Glycosyltransferase n=1 Tax=Cellulomonas avistercoris TaxID=2762242 RepID=A0ABR8Q9V3_9CELL|nr:glycosyltransferase [Cellulomonas avistercoris]MBD7917212.1 glycosyltransferase [Cellulomonas avistercoris]
MILSTADFHSAVWTNKQYLAAELAPHMPVTYIESFGLRRPQAHVSDVRRIINRFRRRDSNTESTTPDGISVVKPIIVPYHDNALARQLNRRLVARIGIPHQAQVLWTFSPLTYGLDEGFDHVVYHSVDLIHEQPLMPRSAILDAERRMLDRADVVIASSIGVRDHLVRLGRVDTQLWQNVADVTVFLRDGTERTPRAVFAGNLTPSKVDFSLIRAVADAGVDVVLAGPLSIDGTNARRDIDQLLAHRHVDYVGNLATGSLADLFSTCQVGLIPYQINDYTAGVFPLKVFEYLASGMSVVSTRLPSMSTTTPPDVLLSDPHDFASTVVSQIVDTELRSEDVQRRHALATANSWTRRGREARDLLEELTS